MAENIGSGKMSDNVKHSLGKNKIGLWGEANFDNGDGSWNSNGRAKGAL